MAGGSAYSKVTLGVLAGLAAAVLVATGFAQAAIQARIDAILAQTLAPAEPLDTLPLTLGDWQGINAPLEVDLDSVGSFDDFYINRIYRHRGRNIPAGVFVGYVGRPRTHMGHRPDVCYAAHGWEQESSQVVELADPNGGTILAKHYVFRAPDRSDARMQVLASYLINGEFTVDPAVYGGWNTRQVNPFGVRRPAYLARVQVALGGDVTPAEFALLKELTAAISAETRARMPVMTPAESDG